MPEAVPVVEDVADSAVEFILFDVATLDGQRGPHVLQQHCSIREQVIEVRCQLIERRATLDRVDLDDFAHTGPEVLGLRSEEKPAVDVYLSGRIECPQNVFRIAEV